MCQTITETDVMSFLVVGSLGLVHDSNGPADAVCHQAADEEEAGLPIYPHSSVQERL